MAPIPVWSGNLRLSLVLVPVKLYPATSSESTIAFRMIHEALGRRRYEPRNLVSPHETSPSATRLNYQRNNLSHHPKGQQRGACGCVGNNPETDEQAERP